MSDDSIQEELLRLGEEAARIREERGELKSRWPKEFRQRVVDLATRGAGHGEIGRVTGLKSWAIYEWRRKGSSGARGFSEMKVVSRRKVSSPTDALVRLRTVRGTQIEMGFSHFRLLLQEDLMGCF